MEPYQMKHLAPDYVYTSEGLLPNKIVTVSDEGYILSVRERDAGLTITDPLPHTALLPGFVNTHSHVFQRALRGHTHHALSPHDTFWTWRRAMYAEAQRLNPDLLYQCALQTYREMLAAGYTSVGEFHYVHHQPNGEPYDNANAMSDAIIHAGNDAGIRVVLLLAAYAQGNFARQPEAEQRRFCDASIDAYLSRVEALRITGRPLGLAPHSVRAVPEQWFRAVGEYSRKYGLPIHVHADEQMVEIEQCLATQGCRPIELLEQFGFLGPQTTVIHATHANARELALLAQYHCTVCVCPTTEGDLGDGIAPYAELLQAGIPLTIGTDSNTRLDPFEELRWAEYSARMRYQRRRILISDQLASPGPLLLTYGTQCGANALGLQTGSITPDMPADFVAIDLHAPSLANWNSVDFLDVLFFGVSSQVITQTWMQGKKVWS
jgi:formimidoylglutamate deiminase